MEQQPVSQINTPENVPQQQNLPENISPKATDKPHLIIILVIVIITSLISGGSTYLLQQQKIKNLENQIVKLQEEQKAEPKTEPEEKELEEPRASEIISVDETWNKYINHNLGFSINFPKEFMSAHGSCKWIEDSYRPDSQLVPTKIFEDRNSVFITSEYSYVLTGETTETTEQGFLRSRFSGCEKVEPSLYELRYGSYPIAQSDWEIKVIEIKSEEEVIEFVKNNYGPKCIWKESPREQAGVFDIELDRGEGLSHQDCDLSYWKATIYSPEKNKLAYWKIIHECRFWKGGSEYSCTDMINSFRFEVE